MGSTITFIAGCALGLAVGAFVGAQIVAFRVASQLARVASDLLKEGMAKLDSPRLMGAAWAIDETYTRMTGERPPEGPWSS